MPHEHVYVRSWPLGVVKQVITSSEGLLRAVYVRTAKGTLIRDVCCISLLQGEEVADDTTISESGR